MGDEHDRGAGFGKYCDDVFANTGSECGVERREGFVQEDHRRVKGQGASRHDPLLLSPGELVGVASPQAGQADQVEQLVDPPGVTIGAGETVPDVPGDAEMRKQSAILGHIAEAPTLGWYVSIRAFDQLPRQADPAGTTPLESGHDPQEGGFAAARRSSTAVIECARTESDRSVRTGTSPNETSSLSMCRASGSMFVTSQPRLPCPGVLREPGSHEQAGKAGDDHDHRRVGGRRSVRGVGLVGPKLGSERLSAGRDRAPGSPSAR